MYMIVFCHKVVSWTFWEMMPMGKEKLTKVDNDNTYILLLHQFAKHFHMDYLILTTYQKILGQFMVKKTETKRGRELPESWAERVKRLVPQELSWWSSG